MKAAHWFRLASMMRGVGLGGVADTLARRGLRQVIQRIAIDRGLPANTPVTSVRLAALDFSVRAHRGNVCQHHPQ